MVSGRKLGSDGGTYLEITLLGGLDARVAGRALELPTRKSQALLAYLALQPGRAHEREVLRALLWPESSKLQAQASLRQALLALRKALPVALQTSLNTSTNSVSLDPARIWVDVTSMEHELAEATRPALERAATLFRGPLLDGFALDEPPFEEWVGAQRARLNDVMVRALEQLTELQAADGCATQALQTALQTLRLEPLQERAHRTVMQLYALQGRRAEALQHYEQCAALLSRELGVEPDAQTKELQRELLRAPCANEIVIPNRGGAVARSAARAADGAQPFVGREAELAWLAEAVAAAAAGQAWLALLRGDAGIGKTRLLEVLAARVRAHGGRCVRGRCFESEQVLPFALWVDLLRSERSLIEETVLRELPAVYRGEIGRLLPAVADRSAPSPVLGDARLLFEACGELLTRAARSGPLLVLLEDLHWADGMSLRLLSFLVRRVSPGAHLCVVGTVRSEELSGAPELRQVLRELAREQRLREHSVAPLGRGEALALVHALQARADTNIDADICEQIVALGEGNPLVIVECVRGLGAGTVPRATPKLPVPERVRELVLHNVDCLTVSARDALVAASVIGREFDCALLALVCASDLATLARTTEELLQRRLLESTASGFYFTHDRVREVVYASALPSRRSILHGAVARALEHIYAGCLDEVAGSIGYHYARAAEAEASIAFLQRFARYSARNYGLEEAEAALAEAQQQSASLPSSVRDSRALELALARCDCLRHLGRTSDVEAILAPFEGHVERLALPALAGPFHACLGLAKSFLGEGPAAVAHGRRALAEAERCDDRRTAGLAHSVLSLDACRSAQFERGIAHGLRAVAILDPETADYDVVAFAYMHLGVNHLSRGACALALENFAHAYATGERAHSARLRCVARGFTGLARAYAAEFETSLLACREAVELAPDPHSAWLSHFTAVRAFSFAALVCHEPRLLCEPLFVASVQALEASFGGSGKPSMPAFAGRAMLTLAGAHLARRDPARAEALLTRAAAPLRAGGDAVGLAVLRRLQGEVALMQGNLEAAASHIAEARLSFEALGTPLEGALSILTAAQIAMLRGDARSEARERELAVRTFRALELPRWVALLGQRDERIAEKRGVP